MFFRHVKYGVFLLLLVACNRPTERMEGYAVHGIDVSHHQSDIDWKEVKKQDIDFIFMKATEGENLRDGDFCDNWDALHHSDLKRGAYHFFLPTKSALAQAQNFIQLVELKNGDLPPVLDAEVSGGASREVILNRMRSWLQIVEMKYNVRPIIYTNLKFYYKYIAGSFDNYPVWISRYSGSTPQLNNGQWAFWQYGNRGKFPGIKGDVDFNVFRGTRQDLDALCLHPSQIFSMK